MPRSTRFVLRTAAHLHEALRFDAAQRDRHAGTARGLWREGHVGVVHCQLTRRPGSRHRKVALRSALGVLHLGLDLTPLFLH